MPDPPRTKVIEISSDVTPEGTYVVAVHPTPDRAFVIDRGRGVRYGLTVLTAVQYADYEAAVFAQISAAKIGEADAVAAIAELRDQRRPLDQDATAPLTFDPILSARTRAGAVRVLLDGAQIAQLETAAAAEHAHAVLAMLAVSELDALYFQWLRGVGVTEPTARHTVGNLGWHNAGWLARHRIRLPETETS